MSVINQVGTRAGDLKRHVQAKHSFEKPFKCNECDYLANPVGDFETNRQGILFIFYAFSSSRDAYT